MIFSIFSVSWNICPVCTYSHDILWTFYYVRYFFITICICIFLFSNTLLCTVILVLLDSFIIFSHICVNNVPWSGFVKSSASMLCVGQNAAFTSPCKSCMSHTKIPYVQCLVHWLLDCFPFSANRIVLLLSWYTVVVDTYSTCVTAKCLVHTTCPIALSITSLASVELLVINFCLVEAV